MLTHILIALLLLTGAAKLVLVGCRLWLESRRRIVAPGFRAERDEAGR